MTTISSMEIRSKAHLARVREILGPAAYEREDILLYQMDCLEAMQRLEDPIVDLTVTSPPYNIGKEYEKPKSIVSYLSWSETWIREVYRLTRPWGAFWFNLGYISLPGRAKAIPLPYLLWERVPFFLLQEVVWNYGAGVAARKMLSPRNEKFLWYVKSPEGYVFNLDDVRDPNVKYPNQKKNGKLKCNPLGKNPTDVWQIPKVTSGRNRASPERTAHPSQFPLAVIERIIRASSNPGDLVMDPFMGSGSTAEAALRLGRVVLGFEIEPRYMAIASHRLDGFSHRHKQQATQMMLWGER